MEERKIIQITSCGVNNTSTMQCGFVLTALCSDGTVWISRDCNCWEYFNKIPQDELKGVSS